MDFFLCTVQCKNDVFASIAKQSSDFKDTGLLRRYSPRNDISKIVPYSLINPLREKTMGGNIGSSLEELTFMKVANF